MPQKFQVVLNRRNVPLEELAADLASAAEVLELNTHTKLQYETVGQFGATTMIRRFGSWNNAIAAAKLEVAHRQDIRDDELFENLAEIWSCLGRQPFGSDLDKTSGRSKFARGTYEKRFSSWNRALLAFQAFLAGTVDENWTTKSTTQNVRTTPPRRGTARTINWRLRAVVLIRDNCICRLCGKSSAKDSEVVMHVDHIFPWSKAGETVQENLQALCQKCNIGKSNLDVGRL